MLYDTSKRILDIIIAVVALIVGFPLFILVSFAIWLEDRGKPFYTQERIGKDRKTFEIYKFRSMVENADEILFSNPKLYEKMRSGSHKVKDDPRITKIGKFIRKYSIDEAPQFFNVLKGEMSFVGPRAYRPDELDKCQKEMPDRASQFKHILSVKPGITGLWQVSGRSNLSFMERLDLEERYALSKSLLLDILIILKTPIAVLKAEGAV